MVMMPVRFDDPIEEKPVLLYYPMTPLTHDDLVGIVGEHVQAISRMTESRERDEDQLSESTLILVKRKAAYVRWRTPSCATRGPSC